MDTHSEPNTLAQTAQSAANQTVMNQTAADRMEKNKYKIPILADRETDLTKITHECGRNKSLNTYISHTIGIWTK